MMDIIDKLNDLHKQATVERSHYYVGAVVKEAVAEIERLNETAADFANLSHGWRKKHDNLLAFIQARPDVLRELIEATEKRAAPAASAPERGRGG